MQFALTPKAHNTKTGPIPVSTSTAKTCPSACPLKNAGCYAETSHLLLHWRAVTEGKKGVSFKEFCNQIAGLPEGQLWRHNQAGDLPGVGNRLAIGQLRDLVRANRGKRGFTYTHKPLTTKDEQRAVADAVKEGFTINLSANSLEHADDLMKLGIAPVVSVVPVDQPEVSYTPDGHKVIVCPAQTRDKVQCKTCALCYQKDRPCIVGFRAHGVRTRMVSEMAKQGTKSV